MYNNLSFISYLQPPILSQIEMIKLTKVAEIWVNFFSKKMVRKNGDGESYFVPQILLFSV